MEKENRELQKGRKLSQRKREEKENQTKYSNRSENERNTVE